MAAIPAQAHETTVERQFIAAEFLREMYRQDGERGGFDCARFYNFVGNAETLFN